MKNFQIEKSQFSEVVLECVVPENIYIYPPLRRSLEIPTKVSKARTF